MGFFDRFRRKPKDASSAVMALERQREAQLRSSVRVFAAARPSRLNDGWSTLTSSADMESVTSLTNLRNRSRALCRDNAHAKRAKTVVVNNVIGAGIGLQANITSTRGRLVEDVNDAIESAWQDWCRAENCHIGGSLHFADLERLLLDETFEAGDVLLRIHRQGMGAVPLSLEVIEAERLAEEWEASALNGNMVRQGVEVNDYFRPVAYWIHERHPGDPRRDARGDRLVRVPAQDIIHLRTITRWPQVRGVPWMHAAMNRLHQLGEFQDAAVIAARIGAEKVMMLKETEDGRLADALGADSNDGTLSWGSQKGQFDILPSGTEPVDWTPQYPHENYGAFVVAALRDIAAAFGVSYESLSRDYSQSNYSSSRLSLIDDRDGWRVLQQWYIRAVRERIHAAWLEAAVLSRAIPRISVADYVARPAYYQSVTWKPRGWSWVDPTKEVNAYKEAEKAGYVTKSDVIAQTGNGRDIEDVIRERRRELDMMEAAGLTTDTDPGADQPVQAAPEPADDDERPVRLRLAKREKP
ncbi:MAG: phage portal protein [Gemmatimonadaceae bacterium]|nr:phage portal protein [Gemmatimonadaceae bacterium]